MYIYIYIYVYICIYIYIYIYMIYMLKNDKAERKELTSLTGNPLDVSPVGAK
jgi:hypothetical protein